MLHLISVLIVLLLEEFGHDRDDMSMAFLEYYEPCIGMTSAGIARGNGRWYQSRNEMKQKSSFIKLK